MFSNKTIVIGSRCLGFLMQTARSRDGGALMRCSTIWASKAAGRVNDDPWLLLL
jgi:hypothetical protein